MRQLSLLAAALCVAGCASPYYADRGALAGGLTGAGAGAIVGDAVGNTTGGALVGAGLGAIAGNMIGASLDDVEARNRAQIAQQMGRTVPAGGVTTGDVIGMTRAGVDPQLIVNHVRANGVAKRLDANELIMLQQEGIHRDVIAAMQTASPPQPAVVAGAAPPGAVYVDPYYYGPRTVVAPYPYPVWYAPPPPPPVSIGFSYFKRR